MVNKKGNLLLENIVFIILNLIFLSILIGFLYLQGGGQVVMEKNYAKRVALLIDESFVKSDDRVVITLNVEDALKEKEGNYLGNIININGNTVVVKLSEKSEAKYYFFNDVAASAYPINDREYSIVVEAKKVKKEEPPNG